MLAGQGERPSVVLRVSAQGLMLVNLEPLRSPVWTQVCPKCSEKDRLRGSPRPFFPDFLGEDCTDVL